MAATIGRPDVGVTCGPVSNLMPQWRVRLVPRPSSPRAVTSGEGYANG